ncbi:hypothetical protein LCM23_21425 [Cytobacillus kochii]|uniref:methyltransferase family protein n=1 Tax=Cytobacillus kochii TaxID=859143 RepID=UPI001CD2C7F0|nr:methyltransferase dimerization domain-containing protein [Cytobacillus kochii]MCA1028634.1 hypothetical protein [Cytobacillus kochii]
MKISNIVTSYKKSVLVFKSIELKIFDYLKEPVNSQEISMRLALNPIKVSMLLDSLYCIGLLNRCNNYYFYNTEETNKYLVSNSTSFLGSLVNLEKDIYRNFVNVNNLYLSLKEDYVIRENLINSTFKQDYQNVVYTKEQYLKLIRKFKKLGDIPSTTYITKNTPVEILKLFSKHTSQLIHAINIQDLLTKQWDNCNIIIPNCIHYLDNIQLNEFLSNCTTNVIITIIDFFGDHLEEQYMYDRKLELYLDWMTHGGIENLNYSDLVDYFSKFNFRNICNIKDKRNGSTLIFRKK